MTFDEFSFEIHHTLNDIDIGSEVSYNGNKGTVQGYAVGNDGQLCFVVDCPQKPHKTNLFPINLSVAPDSAAKIHQQADELAKPGSYYESVSKYWGCSIECDYCESCPVKFKYGKRPYEKYNSYDPITSAIVISCYRAIFPDIVNRVENVYKKEQ